MNAWWVRALIALGQVTAAGLGAGLVVGALMGAASYGDRDAAEALSIGGLGVALGFIVAFPHALLLGLPYALLLRRFGRESWLTLAAGGLIIGAAPLALLERNWGLGALCGACGFVGASVFHFAGRSRRRAQRAT